ncbi:MAG: hypothetical protein Kow0042_13770 [Calditrichia bacterium]
MKTLPWIKSLDYFYLTRPMLFFPGWSTLLAGYVVAQKEHGLFRNVFSGTYRWIFWEDQLVLVMLAFAAAIGGSFIMNQLQDVESDRKNKKLFLISRNYVKPAVAFWESMLLIFISFVIGLMVNFQAFLLLALGILSSIFYNYPPLQFKNRPLSGLAINMWVGWVAFAMGWVAVQNLNFDLFLHSLPYLFLNTGLYFLTTIPDCEGDRAAGKITFCVRFGVRMTIRFALACYFLSILSGMVLNDHLVLSINILTFYWFGRLWRTEAVSAVLKTVKMAIFFFSLMVCFKFPTYFILMVSIFFLTKFYYRQRFGFDYPNFRGA